MYNIYLHGNTRVEKITWHGDSISLNIIGNLIGGEEIKPSGGNYLTSKSYQHIEVKEVTEKEIDYSNIKES